ncbi:Cyclopropane-fatty-acyl-phospholipid synthase [Pseudovibrio axinellae]|uniref:Cyclopropane-fatty-acyl-phospholipid synthase n=1 Tax=Pseudovibrio axinellae TaxID=989403 RepID=A0A166AZD0_9HYPH|nr:cyclopropane-fatty-acyl-phospholipid synthase family protein [Pseudovibrio axinellae]KZL21746.1 Cyclopropane-fatty-acyl-phospholipid synthase [Pseudovibrio axinellae]SEQ21808.1 cyclopropane-fatty-acyl-phospholipid synthase [Pseudovibrio axinellae]
MRVLSKVLERFFQKGQLIIFDAKGRKYVFGSEGSGPTVAIRFHSKLLPYTLLIDPELKTAEAYMDGLITLEPGYKLNDLTAIVMMNNGLITDHPIHRLLTFMREGHSRRRLGLNLKKNKAKVRHHYDLSTDLYRLFLDEGLNYSCAYYRDPDDTLEEAQQAKLDHIVAKLDLSPGMSVLEIGGGWGSLAIRMAQAGAQVTSLNVSTEQIKIAEERVKAAGLEDKVDFVCLDYNEFNGEFDRVVSVGMMEHVGIGNLEAYFTKVRDCLKEDGYAVIHSIGRCNPPSVTGPFISKYIFPGGYCPSLSETFIDLEKTGLWVCDNEILRLHYYYTLRDWRKKFEANRDKIKELYDERFCKMWEFYLSGCEMIFLHGRLMVFQLMLSKKRDAVPIVRDFIAENEEAMIEQRDERRKSA